MPRTQAGGNLCRTLWQLCCLVMFAIEKFEEFKKCANYQLLLID